MGDRITEFLEQRPEGVSALDAARECLGLEGPPAGLERVAANLLSRTPGLTLGADGLWRLAVSSPPEFALAVVATGAHPPVDSLLAIGACSLTGTGGSRPALDLLIRPGREVPDDAIRAAGADPRAVRRGMPGAEALALARATLSGARITTFRSLRPLEILERALCAEGLVGSLIGTPPIRPALLASDLLPPRGDLFDAAAALGIWMPDEPTIGERATALAELVSSARERGLDLSPPPPSPGFDFDRARFGPEVLDDLPERPGVYRFLDEAGGVLYVGKAANLRRRVRDYFRPGTDRRSMHEALMESVRDLDWAETGSEIEALLTEMTEIREHAPPYNVQCEVRRRKPVEGDLVLFLPGIREQEVSLLFVRAGRPAGRATADRRGRGMREVRAALRRIYRDGGAEEAPPEDGEILASWLRRERDRTNHLDLSETADLEDAARRIKAWLTDPDLFVERVFRR